MTVPLPIRPENDSTGLAYISNFKAVTCAVSQPNDSTRPSCITPTLFVDLSPSLPLGSPQVGPVVINLLAKSYGVGILRRIDRSIERYESSKLDVETVTGDRHELELEKFQTKEYKRAVLAHTVEMMRKLLEKERENAEVEREYRLNFITRREDYFGTSWERKKMKEEEPETEEDTESDEDSEDSEEQNIDQVVANIPVVSDESLSVFNDATLVPLRGVTQNIPPKGLTHDSKGADSNHIYVPNNPSPFDLCQCFGCRCLKSAETYEPPCPNYYNILDNIIGKGTRENLVEIPSDTEGGHMKFTADANTKSSPLYREESPGVLLESTSRAFEKAPESPSTKSIFSPISDAIEFLTCYTAYNSTLEDLVTLHQSRGLQIRNETTTKWLSTSTDSSSFSTNSSPSWKVYEEQKQEEIVYFYGVPVRRITDAENKRRNLVREMIFGPGRLEDAACLFGGWSWATSEPSTGKKRNPGPLHTPVENDTISPGTIMQQDSHEGVDGRVIKKVKRA